MGGEMYHAIIAKDYKPLQKLQGFGVHLLLHTNSTAACLGWGAGCARGAWRHSQGWGTALASSRRTGAAQPTAPSFPQKHRDECLQPVVCKGHPVFSWCPPEGARGHRSTWLRAWLGAGLPSLPAGQGEACAVPRQKGLGRACSSKSARLLETGARKVAAGDGQALAVSLTVPLQQNYPQLWAGS